VVVERKQKTLPNIQTPYLLAQHQTPFSKRPDPQPNPSAHTPGAQDDETMKPKQNRGNAINVQWRSN
jgi:hypothetical protein